MFNLIYRDGAPENAGHYEGFQKDAKATVMSVGELVSVTNGVASKYASGNPYGVVARASGDDEEDVAVLRITGDMIFRADAGSDPARLIDVTKGWKCAVDYKYVKGIGEGNEATPFEITEIVKNGAIIGNNIVGMILEGRFTNSN